MIQDIQHLVDGYLVWLKDKTILRQIDNWVEITTPYLDRYNDAIQIYVKNENGGFILSDDGYTIGDLEQSGCTLQSPKRQALLKMTLNGFGVELIGSELKIHASHDNFSQKKHNLLQAILGVNDMFYLAMPVVTSLFFEDVISWLELHDIRYTPNVKFSGKSGFDHLFDFVIPKSRRQPERIIKAISRPDRTQAQALAFSWIDTREVRPSDSKTYAILNDTEKNLSQDVVDALKSYEISPVAWSNREKFRDELAA